MTGNNRNVPPLSAWEPGTGKSLARLKQEVCQERVSLPRSTDRRTHSYLRKQRVGSEQQCSGQCVTAAQAAYDAVFPPPIREAIAAGIQTYRFIPGNQPLAVQTYTKMALPGKLSQESEIDSRHVHFYALCTRSYNWFVSCSVKK
jgi:hypothetical protein